MRLYADTASSIPSATFDYLSSLEWIRARENVCMIGPAVTGKSHTLIALGIAAVEHGHRVRYFIAAEPVEGLYRNLAIDTRAALSLIRVTWRGCGHRRAERSSKPIPRRYSHLPR